MVATPRTDSSRSPRLARGRGPLCLLTTLHPERALSRALVQHLAEEMPDLRFTLEEGPAIDVLWVCGYERGNGSLIRALRAEGFDTSRQMLAIARALIQSFVKGEV
mgnify:CR=1 FL=1